jgi:16S rRNA (cytosine967-C5)-methyltransferase
MPVKRAARVDASRQVAFDVLRAVAERDAYVNLTLPALLREREISGRDAAFATELTHGTLRRRGSYDPVIDSLLRYPVDPPVRDLLRLGAHQLLSMRVPAHAAVATTVELTRANVGERPVSLVNAVLRRVGRMRLSSWMDKLAPPRTEATMVEHLAVVHSHPAWMVAALADALGDLDEVEAMLRADNDPPGVTLVARPGRATVGELVDAGAEPGRWSPYAARWGGGDPGSLPAVREGRAGVQDEGSQLVAQALATARVDGADTAWLDLCAGPGGKASLLAGLAGGRGAAVLAGERLPHRARLVHQALWGAGVPAGVGAVPGVAAGGPPRGVLGVVCADGTRPAWRAGAFDRVIADVPCTGMGALRRRPEARWRRAPEDVAALTGLQRALLDAALDSCRDGGVVAYVTCSPHPAETTGVVDAVLRGRSDTVQEDARALLPDVADLGPGPAAQLWPHRHGTDAMFLSALRRRAADR